jgi:hypothetical protein
VSKDVRQFIAIADQLVSWSIRCDTIAQRPKGDELLSALFGLAADRPELFDQLAARWTKTIEGARRSRYEEPARVVRLPVSGKRKPLARVARGSAGSNP